MAAGYRAIEHSALCGSCHYHTSISPFGLGAPCAYPDRALSSSVCLGISRCIWPPPDCYCNFTTDYSGAVEGTYNFECGTEGAIHRLNGLLATATLDVHGDLLETWTGLAPKLILCLPSVLLLKDKPTKVRGIKCTTCRFTLVSPRMVHAIAHRNHSWLLIAGLGGEYLGEMELNHNCGHGRSTQPALQ